MSSAKINLQHFDSPEDYVEYLREHITYGRRYINSYRDNSFFNGNDFDSALSKLELGDTTNLAAAQKIMDKLELAHLFANEMPILQTAVAGYMPCVPAYIAGHPQAMYERTTIENPSLNAPLRIYIENVVSGGVNKKQLVARGVATLAFTLAMETIRPVELYVVTGASIGGGNKVDGACVRVASRPMDLARAVYMLTDAGYARALHFVASGIQNNKTMTGFVAWPFNSSPMDKNYETKMREVVGAEPNDVYLKGGYLFDEKMLNDPVQWVIDMVKLHSDNHMGVE